MHNERYSSSSSAVQYCKTAGEDCFVGMEKRPREIRILSAKIRVVGFKISWADWFGWEISCVCTCITAYYIGTIRVVSESTHIGGLKLESVDGC